MAEAIAAKGIFENSEKLLRYAAETSPNNPRYWYLLARCYSLNLSIDTWGFMSGNSDSQYRLLLERSLRVDPDYLPALYAYAMSRPSHEQRMQTLNLLTAKDPDNAEPYYLMAIESFKEITKNRKAVDTRGYYAYQMLQQEWDQISGLIEKGNACSVLQWRTTELPSTRDLAIRTRGKAWPANAVKNWLALSHDLFGDTGDSRYRPQRGLNACWRMLASEADLIATGASKTGDNAKAMRYLEVAMDLGYKLAFSEPERYMSWSAGYGTWSIAQKPAVEILKRSGDMQAAWALDKERVAWREGVHQCLGLIEAYSVTIKDVKLSRTDYLSYNDYSKEEAFMKRILSGLKP